ncbi:CAMK/CAMKL protein kinase [Aphanomyces astaci]|uniref:CAMK/CAMKL protein kinase n=1 Tax=Aphanomyces astaci TaxID=112090 RepID=W4FKM5_APHAT|nr:CAMK/CAMKL protein kinase [Aphanomyces astaci]ETV68030.1 CAMK/CAMKL protein kinase [Aphanomyces astaci]|eukprot:XP_009842594.1 CAMK/CAMKL protein kinase [Aphanomyces astaci]
MEQFTPVRTLRDALYGKVVLCQRHLCDGDDLVAIKMMSLASIATKTAVRGGYRIKEDGSEEVAILKSLPPHPSIVNLLEHFEHDGMLCLVLEYCSLGELFDHLHRQKLQLPRHQSPQQQPFLSVKAMVGGLVSERQAATWFRQIVDGVAHIHAHGIAHRDVSLENILLDGNQHCRICDFGLSSREGKRCVGRVGKPFYMAPEVYFGDLQRYNGFQADVWSLGILLFILLSGIPPLEVPSEIDARFRIIRQDGIHVLAKMWGLTISKDALDLLSCIIRAQPDERPSLDEILCHRWFQSRWLDATVGNEVLVA